MPQNTSLPTQSWIFQKGFCWYNKLPNAASVNFAISSYIIWKFKSIMLSLLDFGRTAVNPAKLLQFCDDTLF